VESPVAVVLVVVLVPLVQPPKLVPMVSLKNTPSVSVYLITLTVALVTYPCDEDAADWKGYLQGKGYQVSSLVDSQAKEQSVESALFSIIAAADADDQIVFATSGHGTTSGGKQLLLYADCYAAASDNDGFVGGIVPDVELKNWFAKCTSKVCIIVDHCNSGGLTEAVHTGMILQTTCGSSGYGYDVPEYANGAFTYWYCHKALQQQGYTNAEAAFAWVKANYPYGGKDAPTQMDSLSGNFVF
jgi:hypothetical protein